MTDHFSIEETCDPSNYSWYSWNAPPEQCKLIESSIQQERDLGGADPEGYYFLRDSQNDPSQGHRGRDQ